MHYQKYPYSQDKIIRVLSGKIWDIVIDLRPNSSSYLNSYGVELSQENGEQLFVPSGFAHGFLDIGLCKSNLQSEQTLYASSERGISPFDPQFNLNWPFSNKNLFLVKKIQIGHYSKRMLNNKKILVTGSGGQLGKTLQKSFREHGFDWIFYLKKNLI